MAEPDKGSPSSPEPEHLLKFQFKERPEIDVYLVQLPDGTVVSRTRAELEKEKK